MLKTEKKWVEYAAFLHTVVDASRAEAAEHFGVTVAAAARNLEIAVARGAAEKFYAYVRNGQPGYCYRVPSSNLELFED